MQGCINPFKVSGHNGSVGWQKYGSVLVCGDTLNLELDPFKLLFALYGGQGFDSNFGFEFAEHIDKGHPIYR